MQILHKDGLTLSEELTYCNARTDNTIISNRYCVIPTSTLTAAPYLLVQGDIVRARVLAANIIGDSAYSSVSVVGAAIQALPRQPALAPYRGSLTTTTQIEVLIAPLTGVYTGGATITSYLIEFDDASGGVDWYEIQGFTTYTTQLSAVKTGRTPAQEYRFRYSAMNVFGWGMSSTEGIIKTIMVPAKINVPSTTVVGPNVRVKWSEPANNGAAIASYTIQIRGSDN